MRAIRLRCLDCGGASSDEVAKCKFDPEHPTNPCDLHAFRFGKNPNYKLTDDDRAARAERGREVLARLRSLPAEQQRTSDPDASA